MAARSPPQVLTLHSSCRRLRAETVALPGIFLEHAGERRTQMRQRREIPLQKFDQQPRFARPEGLESGLAERQLLRRHRLLAAAQGRHLLRRELAEAAEIGEARKGIDAQQIQARPAAIMVREPGQQLEQLQLIEQVVLEPQHDALEAGGRGKQAVAGGHLGLHGLQIAPALVGDEMRAQMGQRRQRQLGRHRPFMQHVAPGQDLAVEPRPPHDGGGAVAVGDVEGPAHGVYCRRRRRCAQPTVAGQSAISKAASAAAREGRRRRGRDLGDSGLRPMTD